MTAIIGIRELVEHYIDMYKIGMRHADSFFGGDIVNLHHIRFGP